ncbi:MAG: BrnA antitoxin family protein [Geminicoccaceae bacterium]
MSEGNTTRISAQEALRRIERGESLTDWARVRAMSDADVEAAATDDPNWQDIDPDWVEKAEPLHPVRKRRLTLALDEDVIDWFRSRDRHYRLRMSAILRAYMQRHRV